MAKIKRINYYSLIWNIVDLIKSKNSKQNIGSYIRCNYLQDTHGSLLHIRRLSPIQDI